MIVKSIAINRFKLRTGQLCTLDTNKVSFTCTVTSGYHRRYAMETTDS